MLGATGYKIYKRMVSGAYLSEGQSVSGSVYSYQVGGLTNGTTYYFVVTASNPGGDSGYSNEVSAIPPVPAPGAPVLQPAIADDGQVNITWDPVAGSTGYSIYMGTTSGFYGAALAAVGGAVYGHDATGLTNGTTYCFVVTASNPGGKVGTPMKSVPPRGILRAEGTTTQGLFPGL